MPELRVAIDARLESGIAGGVESVVIGLARGLSSLEAGNERYFFLCNADSTAWLEPHVGPGCELLLAPSRGVSGGGLRETMAKMAPFARTLWRRRPLLPGEPIPGPPRSDGTIETAGIDVMHFTIQSGFLTSVPSIYHPHDLQYVHLPQYFSPRERALRERWYRALCEQATVVAVTSEWGRRDVIAHYGLSPDKVRVVAWAPPTGVYALPLPGEVEAVKAKLALPDAFIFYPAQTWPHKNHASLLRAVARLRDATGQQVPLVFSGHRNQYAPALDRLVAKLSLGGLVTWVGFVTPTELQAIYALSHAVVVPSRFEAASGPLWEAFLAGTPAAVASVASLPDQAGGAALLFDPDNIAEIAKTIERLWTDEDLRADLVTRGRENVRRYSWGLTARMFRTQYRRVGGRPLTDEDRELLAAPSLI